MRSRTIAIMAASLVLSACGAATSGSTATATQPAGAQPSAATAAPTTVAYGTATYVSGTVTDFAINQGTVTTVAPDGTSHSRGGSFTYQLVSDDPRVSGQVTGTWNSDRWGSEGNGALVQWGQATLTNSKGNWIGTWTGANAAPVGDMVNRWWTGTGAYQGLTFFFWMQAKDITDPSSLWHGVIYPGPPPPGAQSK